MACHNIQLTLHAITTGQGIWQRLRDIRNRVASLAYEATTMTIRAMTHDNT